jgi:hypothetical protein
VYSRCYATTARWADIPGPFLGNSSVNTFPLLDSRFLIMQQLYYNSGRDVFSACYISRRTPVPDLHIAFKHPYVFDYITKYCRQQADVIQNHENANVCNIGQREPRHRKYKMLKLGGGQAYDRSSD